MTDAPNNRVATRGSVPAVPLVRPNDRINAFKPYTTEINRTDIVRVIRDFYSPEDQTQHPIAKYIESWLPLKPADHQSRTPGYVQEFAAALDKMKPKLQAQIDALDAKDPAQNALRGAAMRLVSLRNNFALNLQHLSAGDAMAAVRTLGRHDLNGSIEQLGHMYDTSQEVVAGRHVHDRKELKSGELQSNESVLAGLISLCTFDNMSNAMYQETCSRIIKAYQRLEAGLDDIKAHLDQYNELSPKNENVDAAELLDDCLMRLRGVGRRFSEKLSSNIRHIEEGGEKGLTYRGASY